MLLCDPAQERRNNLNLLRLVLALLVLFAHSFPLTQGDNDREWGYILTRGQDTFGELAVNAFFAISGLLILQSWMRSRSSGDYLRKRVLRIYPGFVVATAFSLLLVGALAAPSSTDYFSDLRDQIGPRIFDTLTLDMPRGARTLVNAPIPFQVNGSLWTIRYEFWCYLGVVVLGMSGALRRSSIVALCFATIYLLRVGVYLMDHFGSAVATEPLFLIGSLDEWRRFGSFFAAGAFLFAYRHRVPRSIGLLALSLGILVALAALGVGLNAWLPIGGVYALFYAGFHPRLVPSWFTAGGRDWSYGVYLYAFPVQQLVRWWLGSSIGPYGLFALALGPTFACAALSWHFVERPALNQKRAAAAVGQGTQTTP